MRDLARRLFRIRPRGRAATTAEFRAEIEAHLALAAEHLVQRGVPVAEAEYAARQRFGDFDRTMRVLTESAMSREVAVQRREWWDASVQNARLATRQLRRSPALSIGVALTLALGMGANLVMFDFVDTLLLSPPPGISGAETVRRVSLPQYNFFDGKTISSPTTNYAAYLDLRTVKAFSEVAAFGFPQDASLGRGRDASPITVNGASASFFTVLGAKPALGRFYSAAEDTPPRGSPVAVIGYAFWKRFFQGDRSVLGRSLVIDGMRYTVVGVAAPRFNGVDFKAVDVWLPMTGQASATIGTDYLTDRGSLWMMIVARLADGVDERRVVSEASAAVLHGNERVAKANPHARIELASVIAARGPGNHPDAALAILLFGVTVAVLLIACANVANLLMTRAIQRRQEMAVRLALGVSHPRLLGQLFAESAVIGLFAAAAAVLGSYVAGLAAERLLLGGLDINAAPLHMMAAATILVLAVIVIATLAPAMHAVRVDVASALKVGGRSASDSRLRLQGSLLALQVALSSMLLVGAGLFLRSLHNAEATRIGLDPDRVLLAQVDLTSIGTDAARKDDFWQRARDQVIRLPHVASAALSIAVPMRFSMAGAFLIPGRDSIPTLKTGGPYRFGVEAGFFSTTGARILRGRGFTAADTKSAQRVIVVDETLAALWPNADPIGVCVRISHADTIPCATIVGVVENVHRHQLREDPSYQYYVPYDQWLGPRSAALLVRLDEPVRSTDIETIRRALQEISPDTPFPSVESYADILGPQLQTWRAGASILTVCGLLAFAVSVIGLYSLLSYAVTQRRFELGIRAALGARTLDLMALTLRRALALVVTGIAIGLASAAAIGQRAAPLLLDVSPRDAATYVLAAGIVLAVGSIASVVPARRAATADPMRALRAE